MNVVEAIKTRRSKRKWLQQPVPDELVEQILEAGRWSPSAGNFQPWAFIVIQDPVTKERVQRVAEESKNLSRIWAPYFREGESRGYIVDLRNVPLGIAIFADQRHAPPHVGGEIGHIIGAILEEITMQQMHSTLFTPDPRLRGTPHGLFDFSYNGQRTL